MKKILLELPNKDFFMFDPDTFCSALWEERKGKKVFHVHCIKDDHYMDYKFSGEAAEKLAEWLSKVRGPWREK